MILKLNHLFHICMEMVGSSPILEILAEVLPWQMTYPFFTVDSFFRTSQPVSIDVRPKNGNLQLPVRRDNLQDRNREGICLVSPRTSCRPNAWLLVFESLLTLYDFR